MSDGLDRHVKANKGGLEDASNGVTIYWLAKHFGLEVSTVRQKMSGCPAVKRKAGGHLYLIRDAAPYLVKPKMDAKTVLRTMKAHELPPALNAQFWQAELSRQKWEAQAGELWHTGDVLELFGEVFKRIKFSAQLWPDTLEKMTGLSDEQREALQDQIDVLLTDIMMVGKELAKDKATPASIARMNDMLDEVGNELDDDDGIDDII